MWQGRNCPFLSSLTSPWWTSPCTIPVNITDGEDAMGQGLPWAYPYLLYLMQRVLKLVSGARSTPPPQTARELEALGVWGGQDLKVQAPKSL